MQHVMNESLSGISNPAMLSKVVSQAVSVTVVSDLEMSLHACVLAQGFPFTTAKPNREACTMPQCVQDACRSHVPA